MAHEAEKDDFDQLYNRLVAEEKLKTGTAYEKIAAIIFKVLDRDSTVRHQVRMRGIGKARHWIDVVIEKNNSEESKILIECKDFDGAVRFEDALVFGGRLAQFPNYNAYMITTVGFSREARTYLADQQITPVILREVHDDDPIIKKVVLTFHYVIPDDIQVELLVADDEATHNALAAGVGGLSNPSQISFLDSEGLFVESAENVVRRAVGAGGFGAGPQVVSETFPAPRFVDMPGHRLQTTGCQVRFTNVVSTQTSEITGHHVAALVLADINGHIERVFTEDEILELRFAKDGKTVVNRVKADDPE